MLLENVIDSLRRTITMRKAHPLRRVEDQEESAHHPPYGATYKMLKREGEGDVDYVDS
jgi:hypothetical protein